MRRLIRRFGPALFWQFAWFAVVTIPVAALTYWIASDGSFLKWLWAIGMLVGVILARKAIFRLAIGEQEDRPDEDGTSAAPHLFRHLKVSDDLRLPVVLMCMFGYVTTVQGIGYAGDHGFAVAMRLTSITWPIWFVLVWSWWALFGRRASPNSLPPPVLPGSDLVDARLSPGEDSEDPEVVTVSVSARKVASIEQVVYSVVLLQLIPAIEGGKRRWTVNVDGEPVAIATQTWEHPRWWPPFQWSADPSATYTGTTIAFAPADTKRPLRTRAHRAPRIRRVRSGHGRSRDAYRDASQRAGQRTGRSGASSMGS
ncbi:hypothetical protein [Glycomyces buryatensis]|uniref:Uncharacterized protein n=1 Tax=Glycomyces buryatensis TaxID=2570927 RepID=A0A4S8Q626_9ACTN|nr:hypothetical protein [Glycomyces buryatensis]THV39767.1 hypothetical protein FAB82_16755 [Glycomyces buryatensis]